MHRTLTVDELDRVHAAIHPHLADVALPFTARFTRALFGRTKFWVNLNSVLRLYFPNSYMQQGYGKLKSKLGKLVQHGPHHDYWQDVALNAINIWMALEPVEAGNGMTLFLEEWGKVLPRGKEHVRGDQRLSPALVIPCQPGDIVLFHSQHLHGGELNRTDKTRVVMSTRVVLEPPRHPRLGATLHYFPADKVDQGVPKSAKLLHLLDRVRPTNLLREVERRVGNGSPGHEGGRLKWLDRLLDGNWFAEISDQSVDRLGPHPGIEIVDDKRIRVTLEDGSYELSRWCPHQGGDMACGHVRDGKIYCPMHNQPFDVRTGEAEGPGAGLRPLKVAAPAEPVS